MGREYAETHLPSSCRCQGDSWMGAASLGTTARRGLACISSATAACAGDLTPVLAGPCSWPSLLPIELASLRLAAALLRRASSMSARRVSMPAAKPSTADLTLARQQKKHIASRGAKNNVIKSATPCQALPWATGAMAAITLSPTATYVTTPPTTETTGMTMAEICCHCEGGGGE